MNSAGQPSAAHAAAIPLGGSASRCASQAQSDAQNPAMGTLTSGSARNAPAQRHYRRSADSTIQTRVTGTSAVSASMCQCARLSARR